MPVRADDAPICDSDDEVGLVLGGAALPGRNVTERMRGLEYARSHLGADGDTVILIQNSGDSRRRHLRSLSNVFNGRH